MKPTDTPPATPLTPAAEQDAALAQRLRVAREARGFSQQAVATRSKWADPDGKGLSRTALIGYEAGTSRPGARELRLLCLTLAVSPNELLFGSAAPFQSSHPALEGLQAGSPELRSAVQLAFVLAALKGHERDALVSLALSLAGRQLGDERLGGLRMLALMAADGILAVLREYTPEAPHDAPLEALVAAMSRHATASFGSPLRPDEEGEALRGQPLYEDPDKKG